MKKRNVLSLLLTVALCLGLLATPAAAAGLTPIKDYGDAGFTDVPDNWSTPYIAACYELGLMSGQGEGRFAPSGRVSLAEGIAVAARMHDLWRGGDGVLPQGEVWYDGAVSYAWKHKILTNTPNDYTAPATRAEVAGFLGRALPEEGYTPINQIAALPDVNSATPNSQEILKLYNAGVLSGSDQYGTFAPSSYITRAELAAILCRLAQPDRRMTLSLAQKPVDLTVRTSSRKLFINGAPMVGLVEINGTFYIPSGMLDDECYQVSRFEKDYFDCYEVVIWSRGSEDTVETLNLRSYPPEGVVLGTAAPDPKPLKFMGRTIYGAVYKLAGRYPMISLDALGAAFDGTNFYLNNGKGYSVAQENDLVGERLNALRKGSTRETVTAIHDYIVNTLTYDPRYVYGVSRETIDMVESAYEKASDTYSCSCNLNLAAGYGVCSDYAELFRNMCIRAGIPCEYVSGKDKASGINHAWNAVYIDGQWLYVDCTWDDPISKKPQLLHDYLLVGPEKMAKDHIWEGPDYPGA